MYTTALARSDSRKMADPTAMHGVFMLNHVLPQFVVAAFTQDFYFSAFAQIAVNFMIFNVVLPPRPLPFDFLVELNVIFVVVQLLGALLGVAVARAANVPPVLEVSLPWESCRYAWRYTTWLRAFSSVLLLTIVPGISYDFGVSVWTPGEFLLWGLVVTTELAILYPIVYFVLRADVGKRRPFTSERQLRRFLLLLFVLEVLFVNVWWPFNIRFQRATQLVGVMIALIVVSLFVALLVYLQVRSMQPVGTGKEDRHNAAYYYDEKNRCDRGTKRKEPLLRKDTPTRS